jgi:hypothetical protein
MVEAGESEYSWPWKTRKLSYLKRVAQNAEHDKIAPNWNVTGTRVFPIAKFPVRNKRSSELRGFNLPTLCLEGRRRSAK